MDPFSSGDTLFGPRRLRVEALNPRNSGSSLSPDGESSELAPVHLVPDLSKTEPSGSGSSMVSMDSKDMDMEQKSKKIELNAKADEEEAKDVPVAPLQLIPDSSKTEPSASSMDIKDMDMEPKSKKIKLMAKAEKTEAKGVPVASKLDPSKRKGAAVKK